MEIDLFEFIFKVGSNKKIFDTILSHLVFFLLVNDESFIDLMILNNELM